jgi:hypothetical protein
LKRETLPQRRQCETFDFQHVHQDGSATPFTATVGFYADGRPGEIFLSARKVTSAVDIMVRDAAILLSFALQFGVPVEAVRSAMLRGEDGRPHGVMGSLLDALETNVVPITPPGRPVGPQRPDGTYGGAA